MARGVAQDLWEALAGGPKSPPATGRFAAPGQYVAAHRIRPLVAGWIIDHERRNDARALDHGTYGDAISTSCGSVSGRDVLAFRSGVSSRALARILNCTDTTDKNSATRWVALDTVDRLFVAMGCVHLFYSEPEDEDGTDGFADVYFHPALMAAEAA